MSTITADPRSAVPFAVDRDTEIGQWFPEAWQFAAQLVIEGVLSFQTLDGIYAFAEGSPEQRPPCSTPN